MNRLIILCVALLLSACESERTYSLAEPERPFPPSAHTAAANQDVRLAPLPSPVTHAAQHSTALPNVGSAGPLKIATVEPYMDAQERDFRAHLRADGVGVARIGDSIVLSFNDSVLFEGNSISGSGQSDLERVAELLRHYDHTAVAVSGYTDTSGTPQENLATSQKRAKLVANKLVADGVADSRVGATGYGATHLKVATGPDVKEARNRRVEIQIVPHPQA